MRKDFLPFARPSIGEDAIQDIAESIRSGWITTGPKTLAFEKDFARVVDAPYALAVNSATAGLHLALKETTAALLFLGLEFGTLAVYAVLWQQTLKRMPLSFAYSNKAVCTLWAYLFGLLFFGESLTWGKGIGLAVVLAGVWLVVSDHA